MQRFAKAASQNECSLNVRVSEEREACAGLDERLQRLLYGNNVLIFVVRRSVYELNAGEFRNRNRPLGECPQPVEVFGRELPPIPQRREPCNRVEAFHVFKAGYNFVVISTYKGSAQLTRACRDFVRAGAITNYVAEVHDSVMRRRCRNAGFQSFEITVNVAE